MGDVLDLTFEIMAAFGFDEYDIMLSTRPEKYVGELDMWDHATESLRLALVERGLEYGIDEGGGAFYGPKSTSKSRTRWGGTGNAPRCSLTSTCRNGSGWCTRTSRATGCSRTWCIGPILGSLERFFGVLVEHYAGAFPLWLAPVQAVVIPIADRHIEYAERVAEQLRDSGFRVEVDDRSERMNQKIRQAQLQKTPYMLVVGDREAEAEAAAVRTRDGDNHGATALPDIVGMLNAELEGTPAAK